MPRLAIILTFALWALLAGAAQAQTISDSYEYDNSPSNRAPVPPQRIPDNGGWPVPIAAKAQAATNQEMSVRTAPENAEVPAGEENEPAPMPLLPPPRLDEAVKPAAYQGIVPAEDMQPTKSDAAAMPDQSTPDKSIRETGDKTPITPQNWAKTPLAPSSKAAGSKSGKPANGLPSMISIAGSTGLVLGIFLLLVWIVRRKTPQAMVRLPGEAFEILGRAPLNGRQQVQLLRCGSRLLLVSVTPGGAETLTEITDPAEVDRLAGLCRQTQPGSSSAAFKQIFEQLAPRRPGRGEYFPQGQEGREMSAGYSRGDRAWEDRHV